MARSQILVIDDEPLMGDYVQEALIRAGHDVDVCTSGPAGLELMRKNSYDLLFTDLRMEPMNGIEVLQQARKESPGTHCIIMTAYATVETAVAALKEGAVDYVLKPFEPDALELAVSRVLQREQLARENRYLRAEVTERYDFDRMVGGSAAISRVYESIRRVADSRATVLIRGESGTGKELVARALHYKSSRRDMPFIKVNCAALSAGLLESELFGHEKGAFTGALERKIGRFELADTGTLLLDEVSEISPELQPKLLRALQEREFERVGGNRAIHVDTRIICTTNRDLERAMREGRFREDLFFRLNVVPIHLPSLRERREDIPALMEFFLNRFVRENARPVRGFAPEAARLFMEYDWPGNVRELQNAVERAVVLSTDAVLGPEHFALGAGVPREASSGNLVSVPVGTTVGEMEKILILRTLEQSAQNRTRAAEVLGISVRTLRNKLKEYGQNSADDDE
ncbi:MAG TPA: sigma-54 dependent transcriptional regulator [Candidatus Hydrogenedentes bacterium]|jgi:DNA-binding NtrC family response regulator|nr:sigma-54 dependent transcriptional regulator [Candidatus Hydrogenedentota bacterium]